MYDKSLKAYYDPDTQDYSKNLCLKKLNSMCLKNVN